MVTLWGWVLDMNPTFFSPSKWRPFKQIKELTIVLSLREIANPKKSQTIFHIIVLPPKLLFVYLRTINNKSYVE